MKNAFWMSGLAAAMLLGGCDPRTPLFGVHSKDGVSGDSPVEIAASLQNLRKSLSPKRAEEFGYAVDTLTRVVPDQMDSRTVGVVSPQFIQMVRGRNADQIIQLATLYRLSAPPNPR